MLNNSTKHELLRKFKVVVSCICFCTALNSQPVQSDNDILYWTKNSRLTFSDFQGMPSQKDTTFYEASPKILTHKLGSIIKSIDVHLVTESGKTTFTIYAGMKKNLSWIKDYGDTISLKHEQGHFDICEIYTRIFRQEIKNAKSLSEAKAIFDKVSTDEELEQGNYDRDNTFQLGGITKDWSEKIINRLKELEPYSNSVVTLSIDN